jgi:DNA-binding MarR family transcriptional regulator
VLANQTEELARQILEVFPFIMRSVAAEMRQSGYVFVPAHFQLLTILEHHACSLSELAERQSVSLPTMSNSVTILEDRGWVKRTRSTDDRRKVVIAITSEGRAALADAARHAQRRIAQIVEALSPEQQAQILTSLQLLREVFVNAVVNDDCLYSRDQQRED